MSENPWTDPRIAEQQRELVDRQLAERPWPVHFRAFADAIMSINHRGLGRVLDIGCGVGGGRAILDRAGVPYDEYSGIDLNPDAIRIASERYPDSVFVVHEFDRAAGETMDRYYDIVADTACMMHVDDWRAHLAALCASSRDAVILHRLPISPRAATFKTETRGYGHVFPAWSFSFPEVVGVMASHGFEHTETRKADGDSLTLTFRKANR